MLAQTSKVGLMGTNFSGKNPVQFPNNQDIEKFSLVSKHFQIFNWVHKHHHIFIFHIFTTSTMHFNILQAGGIALSSRGLFSYKTKQPKISSNLCFLFTLCTYRSSMVQCTQIDLTFSSKAIGFGEFLHQIGRLAYLEDSVYKTNRT